MVSSTALNNETICDLKGVPLKRESAAFLKAIDKLLTVRAYYSPEHEQYVVASEEVASLIVEAIRPERSTAIEITASGMMIKGQLVDPNHRNVRLLHELLVPLNIAQLNIDVGLTPEDLRLAVSALQEHRLSLGTTTGFREVIIEGLPPTVNTASKGVVHRDGFEVPHEGEGSNPGSSLDDLLNSAITENPSEIVSESEKLARKFMEIVNQVLDSLEKEDRKLSEDGSAPHPDSTPENIRALREALQRLVEVNPDPGDLARLIQHAKKALDLSQDPRSVDLVFSLLKNEAANGGDWKKQSRENHGKSRNSPFQLNLEQLKERVSALEAEAIPIPEPTASSLTDYLGVCLHLLRLAPSDNLEDALVMNLEKVISDPKIVPEDLECCSAAATDSAFHDQQTAIDRLLPAFCAPLRESHPEALADFWIRVWENLELERRPLAWPHLVNDLMQGLGEIAPETEKSLWLAAAKVPPKVVVRQVSRLECLPAMRNKKTGPGLMKMSLQSMFPIHLALMKSSLAPLHGPRIHHHLRRQPPNELAGILIRAAGKYDEANINFYLSLIRHSKIESMSQELRRMSARLLADSIGQLKAAQRSEAWVVQAIGWLGQLDFDIALPLLNRIRNEKRFFILFKTWPEEVRQAAGDVMAAEQGEQGEQGEQTEQAEQVKPDAKDER